MVAIMIEHQNERNWKLRIDYVLLTPILHHYIYIYERYGLIDACNHHICSLYPHYENDEIITRVHAPIDHVSTKYHELFCCNANASNKLRYRVRLSKLNTLHKIYFEAREGGETYLSIEQYIGGGFTY